MNNAVEIPPSPVRGAEVWPLSIAAYRSLGEAGLIPQDTELLYGTVYRKMSKSPLHSALLRRLRALLSKTLPPGFFIDSEQPITCADSEPEPDIAVIRGKEEDFWDDHPRTAELVAEICVTSHEYDLSKLRAYATAGVKESWFVLGADKGVEVYREPNRGEFAVSSVYGCEQVLSSAAIPGMALRLADLFEKQAGHSTPPA